MNDTFEVVFDTTDFGHSVGEVELQHTMEVDDDNELLAQRQALSSRMDREIETFINQYSWAFPSGKPIGKLSAYFGLEAIKSGK